MLKGFKPGSSVAFGDLKVWNPSIRKFQELPSLPEMGTYTFPTSGSMDVDIGLGYDPLANDYKHVKLIGEHGILHSVAVYSLGTGSWKIIPFQGEGCSWQWHFGSIDCLRIVCLRGSLYFIVWDAFRAGQHGAWHLVSFDLSREVFCSIRKPDAVRTVWYPHLVLIDGGCSLAMFDGTASGSSCNDNQMWALESSGDGRESMCWTKRYSFRLLYDDQVMHLKKNGLILTWHNNYAALRDKPVGLLDSVKVVAYDPETEEHEIVELKEVPLHSCRHVYPYVESLNLLK